MMIDADDDGDDDGDDDDDDDDDDDGDVCWLSVRPVTCTLDCRSR